MKKDKLYFTVILGITLVGIIIVSCEKTKTFPAIKSPVPCEYPVITDFECDEPSHPITGALTTITNPVSGGVNTSTNVGEYTDDAIEAWDNLTIDYETTIDLTTNNQLKFKFYSLKSVQVLAKLEGEGGINKEIWSDFSQENIWQEYSFDFSESIGEEYTKLLLFFNPTVGNGMDTYYIDDLLFEAK